MLKQLFLDVPHESMAQELLNIKNLSRSTTQGVLNLAGGPLTYEGLSSLCLYGYGPHMTLPDHCYPEREPFQKKWNFEIECPISTQFLKTLPINLIDRVRVQYLAPGGFLAPHQDNHDDTYTSLNISIVNEKDCHFLFAGLGAIQVSPGTAYLMNTSYQHSVVNLSSLDRISVIITGHLLT